jgi:hypothetical protein
MERQIGIKFQVCGYFNTNFPPNNQGFIELEEIRFRLDVIILRCFLSPLLVNLDLPLTVCDSQT